MYYSVTEFAEKIGVSASTLRVWDKEGKLSPHHITDGGKRFYSDEQLSYFDKDKRLDSLGTINGVDFASLSESDMKQIIDRYEADLATINRDMQGMIGLLKSIYQRRLKN